MKVCLLTHRDRPLGREVREPGSVELLGRIGENSLIPLFLTEELFASAAATGAAIAYEDVAGAKRSGVVPGP